MGREPASLFLYGDSSDAARTVREAIYDGPFDVRNFSLEPVILTQKPALEDGSAKLEAVDVTPGAGIVDPSGNPTVLTAGTAYLPSGCAETTCAITYTGETTAPVKMDQLVVQFKLRPDLKWSDGSPLAAEDSVYSYEVARSLYPRALPDLVRKTAAYQAVDAQTVEWRGLPGLRDSHFQQNFFTPLPKHAWAAIPPADLLTVDLSARRPLGWGPYVIDEWQAGDHITLTKNANYFRAGEGLPYFDRLVFRFVSGDQALNALLAGECDYVDESAGLDNRIDQLKQLQADQKVAVRAQPGVVWEHIDFGVRSLDANLPPIFAQTAVRQAVALCIDREKLAKIAFFSPSKVPDSFVPAGHPLHNPKVKQYGFDPQAAGVLLDAAGWLDTDQNPATPRLAQGVPGIPDGTPLAFTLLTTDEAEKPNAARLIQATLASCGIEMTPQPMAWNELMSSGPEGPVFGRKFQAAQYAWAATLEPPCYLYITREIPGPYPEFPKGWGGANASGYSNTEFDQACAQAMGSLPGQPEYTQAHAQAQAIFSEDLPSLPLYARLRLVVTRPDLCNAQLDPSALTALSNLEMFADGDGCKK